jgi:Ca2+-binding EF-hand superfamily protein
VKFYSFLFNEIDLNANNRISRDELEAAFEKFNWSKPESKTVKKYVEGEVSEDGLTLSQFITFQKDLT